MKSTVVIGAVVASIAVLANIGTIYDNACKYIVTCNGNPEPQPNPPGKSEVVLICNGRTTKLEDGTIVCEPASQKEDADALPTVTPSGPRPGKCGEFHYWTPSGCKDAQNKSAGPN
jgi:hypothetical protein